MRPRFQLEVIYQPHPDAEQERAAALEIFAEALADRAIANARAQVARELGISEEELDREHERFAGDTLTVMPGLKRDLASDGCDGDDGQVEADRRDHTRSSRSAQ